MSMYPQRTVPRRNDSIPLDPRSVETLKKDIGSEARAVEGLLSRSYLSRTDGTGWSFYNLFDAEETWAALRADMPHALDFGLQMLPSEYKDIQFMIFWPGYDPRGLPFKIDLWRQGGSATGVRDYPELVLEIARCYDAFFRMHKGPSTDPDWDVRANPRFMAENLGLVAIVHAGGNVFYADVEYRQCVYVRPPPPAPAAGTSFPLSTPESISKERIFKMPTRVDDTAATYLKVFFARFPYPSQEQCARLAVKFAGGDVMLIRIWFEAHHKRVIGVTPAKRYKAAEEARKATEEARRKAAKDTRKEGREAERRSRRTGAIL